MAYASIENGDSHRQNKAFKQRPKVCLDSDFLKSAYEFADARLKQSSMTESQVKEFKQRLKYRLEQGCSLDEAFELASMKLRLVPLTQSPVRPDGNNPQKNDQRISSFRPTEDEKPSDENSSEGQKACLQSVSSEPSRDEILRVKEELIRKGMMTEIPAETNSAEAAEYSSKGFSASSDLQHGKKSKNIAAALDGLSGVICVWLVLSMTAALPGAWYSTFPIAMAIEFTPLLVFRAEIDIKNRLIPDLAGVAIFILGLLLYLAPSAQTVWNETRGYSSALLQYAHDLSTLEEAQGLISKAKIKSESSESAYQEAVKKFGVASWRTANPKNEAERDLKDLKDLVEKKTQISFPVAPQMSSEVTEAAQTIATRIILFGAMFLLMFVRRKL